MEVTLKSYENIIFYVTTLYHCLHFTAGESIMKVDKALNPKNLNRRS